VKGAGSYLFDCKALDAHAIFLQLHYFKKMEINSSSVSAIYRIGFLEKNNFDSKERK